MTGQKLATSRYRGFCVINRKHGYYVRNWTKLAKGFMDLYPTPRTEGKRRLLRRTDRSNVAAIGCVRIEAFSPRSQSFKFSLISDISCFFFFFYSIFVSLESIPAIFSVRLSVSRLPHHPIYTPIHPHPTPPRSLKLAGQVAT